MTMNNVLVGKPGKRIIVGAKATMAGKVIFSPEIPTALTGPLGTAVDQYSDFMTLHSEGYISDGVVMLAYETY